MRTEELERIHADIRGVADQLFRDLGLGRKSDRQQLGRHLNAVNARLRTQILELERVEAQA